jgi:ATP-binding cassette subfamily B protein
VAHDLRNQIADKISRQTNATVEQFTASVLLTNLTSDVDAVKTFVAQAVPVMVSSGLLIIGASILLLMTDWQLALVVLLVIPIIGVAFSLIFGQVRVLFKKGQELVDWLNKVINESILGSALIRILHSENQENEKFKAANAAATAIGLQILGYFSSLIPIISLTGSLATLAILILGGHYVITDAMTIGSFTAFMSYLTILIFPIIMMGFMSNVVARSTASYERITLLLAQADPKEAGTETAENLRGEITVRNAALTLRGKTILKPISFTIPAGSRTALIGPTAAGKTQLLSLLVGLMTPTSGSILYDGKKIEAYDRTSLFQKIGLVFQESVLFNLTLRENIAFSEGVSEIDLKKAIETAELDDFIGKLPKGLDTVVSERGTSLSGGQKQRLMLARALARNPKVLLLDDFTARVDLKTEQQILENLRRNYPGVTLISITQKIASVTDYDKILVLMEGELIAEGTHKALLKKSPEYIQMYESQKSTQHYEVSTR